MRRELINMDKTEWVYCEYYDTEEKQWFLIHVPADKALAFQFVYGENFHYLDSSMVED